MKNTIDIYVEILHLKIHIIDHLSDFPLVSALRID